MEAHSGAYSVGTLETETDAKSASYLEQAFINDHQTVAQERCEQRPQPCRVKFLALRIQVRYKPREHRLEQEPHKF